MILVTGSILGRDDTIDELLELSLDHVRRSLTEPGCLSHGVHRDAQNPLRLMFVEEWESHDALAAHFQLRSSRDFVAEVARLSAEAPTLKVFEATPVADPLGSAGKEPTLDRP